jgi:acyl-coenzyme A thioesterase PaaI-like protein
MIVQQKLSCKTKIFHAAHKKMSFADMRGVQQRSGKGRGRECSAVAAGANPIDQPVDASMFDNPFLELLGARRTHWRDGYAQFEAEVRPVLLNRQGVLQGGLIATLLDAACGYAGLYSPDPDRPVHGLTLSLTCNYLDRGVGELIMAKGFLERKGSSVYFARGEVWVDGTLLVATAQGTFKYTAAPRHQKNLTN